jgi:putative hydrolase of the HAD superfamily
MRTLAHTLVAFDLDDTLYKEIDYLRSAYREIALYATHGDRLCGSDLLALMMQTFRNGGNAFRQLNKTLKNNTPIETYLQMYRSHRPDINLAEEVRLTLDELKAAGCTLAIITDGRSVQQRNKIAALGLDRWIAQDDIIISEEIGTEKPSEANYLQVMQRHPEMGRFVYVGDNPAKDFITPNRLGWTTVCLRDNGENIHLQKFNELDMPYQPQHHIVSLTELPKLLTSTLRQ